MTNRVITFLEEVGHDFKVGLQKLDPFIKEAIVVGTKMEDTVSSIDPGLGTIFKLTIATVASIEQKFTAIGQATGTGVQKLAEATTILEPTIAEAFAAAGKANDTPTVQKYISAVVDFLNAIPSRSQPAAAAPGPIAA